MNYIELSNSELLLLHLIIQNEAQSGKHAGMHKVDIEELNRKLNEAIINIDEGDIDEN